MAKTLVLLSGGLDSMLAAHVLMDQGVEITGLSFNSNFFNTAKAKKAAGELGIELIEIDFSDEHLEMVKNPEHGYGKNMNPCIDCHGLMLKKAKEIMDKEGFDFVATGEVLGQRPMSQNKESLKVVEKISGLEGKLIRPLSAKLLDESEPEKNGKLIRERLLDISGRSRQKQLELVKKYGIKEYASPGGGCLLTDPEFSEKLLKILEYWPDCKGGDIELLKYGRVFWLKDENNKNVLLIIGRDEKDNKRLEKLVRSGDIIIELIEENGPTSLIRGIKHETSGIIKREVKAPEELKMSELKFGEKKNQEEIIGLATRLTGYYAAKLRGKKVKLNIINN